MSQLQKLAVIATVILGLMVAVTLIRRMPSPESSRSETSSDRPSAASGKAIKTDAPTSDSPTAASGTVQGRILFSGEVRRSPSGGGDFADVVIYLEGDPPANSEPTSQGASAADAVSAVGPQSSTQKLQSVAVLDQIDMTFIPHVVTMHAGQVLELRNSDTALHNVNGLAVRNPAFNIALPPRSIQQVVLSRPEFIRIVCNFHARMSAWIAVLPNRFFTRANPDGTFELRDLPAGNHRLSAWQETLYPPHKPVQTSITIQIHPGRITQADLNFP